jgi:pre-mRNA-processing factor SLU7
MRKQHEEEAEAEKTMDERKRSYNSTYEVKAPSEAEVEAYYRKRQREEDPMKQFQ